MSLSDGLEPSKTGNEPQKNLFDSLRVAFRAIDSLGSSEKTAVAQSSPQRGEIPASANSAELRCRLKPKSPTMLQQIPSRTPMRTLEGA